MSALLHLAQSVLSGSLELNALNHPWKYHVIYAFPPEVLAPLPLLTFLVEYVTGQFRLLILVRLCWMEASWLPTVLTMLKDIPHLCPIVKKSHQGCFSRLGTKGSAITEFIPRAGQMCVYQMRTLFLSLSGSGRGNSNI